MVNFSHVVFTSGVCCDVAHVLGSPVLAINFYLFWKVFFHMQGITGVLVSQTDVNI